MSRVSSSMTLDKLPAEIIHRILKYLPSHEIFISLHNINLAMNSILNTYNQHHLKFESVSLSTFSLTLHRLDPCHIISLTLSNMDDTPGQFQLFLALFTLKDFHHLQSLQLLQPSNPVDFNKILTDLPTLKSLRSLSVLHCLSASVNQETFRLFSFLIYTSTSLQRLYISGVLNPIFEYDFTSSIHTLYYNDSLFNTVSLQTIACRMPHLKSLDTALTVKSDYTHLSSFRDLTRLMITIFYSMNTLDLKTLLHQLSTLRFLRITASGQQWFDGQFWEEHLPSSVQTFQFNFSAQAMHSDERKVLETFQTSFWLKEKKWSVILDQQMNANMTHLYSLPFFDTQFYYRPSADPVRVIRSSVPTNKSYMNSVTSLTVDLVTLMSESNLSLSTVHFFPNVSTLNLADSVCCSSIQSSFDFLRSILNLTNIVELKLGQFHHPDLIEILYKHMTNLRTLRIAETMFTQLEMLDFRRIRRLVICDCVTNVDRMCLMFPSLQSLCVRLSTCEEMQQVIVSLEKSLINVTFKHVNQDLQEHLINWLSEYCGERRRFSYDTDEHINLHIWLSDVSL